MSTDFSSLSRWAIRVCSKSLLCIFQSFELSPNEIEVHSLFVLAFRFDRLLEMVRD